MKFALSTQENWPTLIKEGSFPPLAGPAGRKQLARSRASKVGKGLPIRIRGGVGQKSIFGAVTAQLTMCVCHQDGRGRPSCQNIEVRNFNAIRNSIWGIIRHALITRLMCAYSIALEMGLLVAESARPTIEKEEGSLVQSILLTSVRTQDMPRRVKREAGAMHNFTGRIPLEP